LLRLLVDSDVDRQAFASLRLVISAGSALTSEVAHAFREKFETRVHGFYGSTETGGICYDRTGEATLEGRSVGTPLDGVDLLFRRGGRFEVRSAAVVGRGRFTPKDRGKLNERGELVLLGRIGRITKIAGRRLDLGEVESLLRRVRGVADAYVALHPQREESLVAMVATNRRVMELRREMAEISASWKIPAKMIVLKEFPMTARGKVDTRKLRALIGSRCSDQG
jgi:acyl-coenzyme A synthetase/AMP-(fatty) acid ligase